MLHLLQGIRVRQLSGGNQSTFCRLDSVQNTGVLVFRLLPGNLRQIVSRQINHCAIELLQCAIKCDNNGVTVHQALACLANCAVIYTKCIAYTGDMHRLGLARGDVVQHLLQVTVIVDRFIDPTAIFPAQI